MNWGHAAQRSVRSLPNEQIGPPERIDACTIQLRCRGRTLHRRKKKTEAMLRENTNKSMKTLILFPAIPERWEFQFRGDWTDSKLVNKNCARYRAVTYVRPRSINISNSRFAHYLSLWLGMLKKGTVFTGNKKVALNTSIKITRHSGSISFGIRD